MGRNKTREGAGKSLRTAEAELIARARAGDRAAELEIYERHRRRVAANLFRVLGNRPEIEDLVQEVFVIAFRGLERFRQQAQLSTWIYRITMNVALGDIRRRSRRPKAVPLDAAVERAPDPNDNPERLYSRQQDRELCYRVMEGLSAKKRIVLYLHEIEGLELKEIAKIVGANPVTVRTRLFYAKREFYRLASDEMARQQAEEGDE